MDRRRQELLGWIEETKRNQRKLGYLLGILAAVSVGLALWSKPVGTIAFFTVAALGICGFWVMAAHNASHYQKLNELTAAERRASAAAKREL